MSEHCATVAWPCTPEDSGDFARRRYSRRHTWHFDGGAVVAASSSPHVVPPPGSDPACVDPEEAFVAALASCHMLWFLDIACRAGWEVASYRDDAVGQMARNAQGRLAITVVTLRPAVRFRGPRQPDAAEVRRLHHQAHEDCFLAASVTTELRCEPVAP